MAHPTIATIAKHLGLSRATVTHVLNGKATIERIRPETQQRVLEAAQKMGYRANPSARAVRSGRFGSVALIQSLWGQYLPPELLTGLMGTIADKDLHLVFSQVQDQDLEEETYLPHTLRDLAVDGVILNRHVSFSPAYLERIQRLRIPAISLNTKQECDAIHPADRQGGEIATEFLLSLGHERITYVDSHELLNQHYSKLDRLQGYEQAMTAAGKVPHIHLIPKIWHHTSSDDERILSVKSLLGGESRPTAIVAYELTEAMATVHAAHQLGLRVPHDLSVVLFHSRLDNRYFLPFHTISNQMEQVGSGAVEMLIEKMENPDSPLPTRTIPAALREGMTCQAPSRNH